VFDRALLEKVKQELQRQYFAQGKYAVEIETTQTPLERNRVGIDISVREGASARVKEIKIVGNHSFQPNELLDQFNLGVGNWISWLTKKDWYSKQKLSADLEELRTFYFDRGYMDFRIDSTQVTLSQDLKSIFITINITEGDFYQVSAVDLAGDLIIPREELLNLITIQPGDSYSFTETVSTAEALMDALNDKGYAFSNFNLLPEKEPSDGSGANKVKLVFFLDPGKKTYVNRVNISGNTRTEDSVIRREIRLFERGRFSTSEVKRSKERLEKLGYFDEVVVETPRSVGYPDRVDANFEVHEKSTGNLMGGVGYSNSSGIVFSSSISQDNFLGTGKRVSADVNTSSANTQYGFQFDDPYFTLDGVSIGYGAYLRETDASELDIADYTTNVLGADLRYGIPVSEYDRVRGALGFSTQEITCGSTYTDCKNFLSDHASDLSSSGNIGTINLLKASARWSSDSRNKSIFPDRGSYLTLFGEASIPGSDAFYLKGGVESQKYSDLAKDALTLLLKGDVKIGASYSSSSSELPFFERFYSGGMGSVRGYKENSLGPQTEIAGIERSAGGSLAADASIELLLSPSLLGDIKGVRAGAFFDVGNVYSQVSDFDMGDLRMSSGFKADWISPIGPLNFVYAFPINSLPSDETETFQFTMGRTF